MGTGFSRSRPENFFLFLLLVTIVVLVLWSLRRIRSACHKQDAMVPLLAAAVKRQAPHLPAPRLRQKYAIQEDALWDSGREICRDWLNSLPGLPLPEYEAPGKPENPATKQCRESYNALPGVKPVAAGTESALPQICALVEIFKKAATGAGKELNARTFVEALRPTDPLTFFDRKSWAGMTLSMMPSDAAR